MQRDYCEGLCHSRSGKFLNIVIHGNLNNDVSLMQRKEQTHVMILEAMSLRNCAMIGHGMSLC